MRTLRYGVLGLALVALLAPIGAIGAPSTNSSASEMYAALKEQVPHLRCVDDRLATGGQPEDGAFGELGRQGFHSVVNLRTSAEGAPIDRERRLVEAAGMRYLGVPVDGADPTAESVADFLEIVRDASNYPMLIHCSTGNRVGAYWMIHRVLDDGWSEDAAETEARAIGLHSDRLLEFARETIEARRQPN
jgi:uncharacterized protein (TIGR01244 family)